MKATTTNITLTWPQVEVLQWLCNRYGNWGYCSWDIERELKFPIAARLRKLHRDGLVEHIGGETCWRATPAGMRLYGPAKPD